MRLPESPGSIFIDSETDQGADLTGHLSTYIKKTYQNGEEAKPRRSGREMTVQSQIGRPFTKLKVMKQPVTAFLPPTRLT